MKKFVSILLIVMLMLSLGASAFADDVVDGSIIYKGGAEKYIYDPAMTDFTSTDMFNSGFKGAMPGDTLTGAVGVGNLKSGNYDVKLYMKALPHDEENPLNFDVSIEQNNDFLSQLQLKITNRQNGAVIFDGTAAETDGLSDWVLLGTFSKGKGTILDIELTIPIELGNEYAGCLGEVDWIFLAEEIPTDPNTGDNSNLTLYLALCGISALALGAVLTLRKRFN